jgi:hypothetical protein
MAALIAIAGMIFSIGLPLCALVVWIVLDYRKRRRVIELHHAERMAAIERGMDVPPLSSDALGRPPTIRTRSTLLPGLIWLFVGIAVTVGTRGTEAYEYSLFGLVPAGIGLAYLLYYALEGRKLHELSLEEAKRALQEKPAPGAQ